MDKNIHWYEVCFYGDEDENSPAYDAEKACSYVVKTEIADTLKAEKTVPEILLNNMPENQCNSLRNHVTAVMEISEAEAKSFDIDDLTVRVTDNLGTYYIRNEKDKLAKDFACAMIRANSKIDRIVRPPVIIGKPGKTSFLGKKILDENVVYALPIEGGHLDIRVSIDPDYPGIDIEFISDDKSSQNKVSRPRVLIEKPIDGKLRVLVWGNPDQEDYSEEVDLEE